MPKEPETLVELEFYCCYLLRVERDPRMIFIGILVVETDPVLYYIDICVGLKDTQDRFEIEPTLNFMNICIGLKKIPRISD